MSIILKNNANGGVNGANVSYDNMGEISGDPYDYRFLGTGCSITYATSPGRAGLCFKYTTTTNADSVFFEWQRFPRVAVSYVRIYAYVAALPSGSIRFCEVSDGSNNICFSIGLRNTGQIVLRDAVSTQIAASTVFMTPKRWMRFEFKLTSHPTAGQVDFRLYTEADSPYHAERMNSTATFNTQPAVDYGSQPRFGISGLSITNYSVYLDELGLSDAGWLGPADASASAPLFISNNAETGTDGQVVTKLNSGNSTNQWLDGLSPTGTVTFSSTQKTHGTLSYYCQPTSGDELRIAWMGLATSSAAIRFYMYFTGFPPASTEFGQLTTSSTGSFNLLARYIMTTAGRISIYDSAGTIWTSTNPISLNTWYRFELFASLGSSATNGTLQAAYYLLDNTTPVENYSTTGANLGTTNFGYVRIGKMNSNTWTTPFYIDSIAAQQQASGFIGPYTGDMPAVPSYPGIIPQIGWGRRL